MIPMI